MENNEFISLGVIGIVLLVGFILGIITSIITTMKEIKSLEKEVDKFRDLYFEEMDKQKNKYDNDDYEAYQIHITQIRIS